jgi:Asp-tRNA(Asn)/Glu-tRNA(Gln) amidotransferase A subunit family amidase
MQGTVPDDNPSDAALPAGLESLGGPFDEPALIRIASAYERAAKRRVAPASTPATTAKLRSRSRSG